MRTNFSKPGGDIASESEGFAASDDQRLARQRVLAAELAGQSDRESCLLCGATLNGARGFDHRGVPYVHCPTCDHVQVKVVLPEGYPHAVNGVGFEAVYPKLDYDAYVSRRERVYAPKRDWIMDCLEEAGQTREQLCEARWQELGCGAGYFLSALQDAGVKSISGVDQNAQLVELANDHLGHACAQLSNASLADVIGSTEADIIASFFVFEHLEDARDVWAALAQKPSGTTFAFSVPVFSFATLLESAFPDFSARNLDTVLHTQLYTDRSIEHALKTAGYTMRGEWVFGQDALDFKRLLMKRLVPAYGDDGLHTVEPLLARMVDDLQGAIDRNYLADARHIVAIKN